MTVTLCIKVCYGARHGRWAGHQAMLRMNNDCCGTLPHQFSNRAVVNTTTTTSTSSSSSSSSHQRYCGYAEQSNAYNADDFATLRPGRPI